MEAPENRHCSGNVNAREIRYVIITPVRNEAENLEANIESVVSQTIKPAEWILVNDGSTDATGVIIDKMASRNTWIKAVHRGDRGFRHAGTGVIESFNDGYDAITVKDWDYLVKLDGDLTFAPDYFERCFEKFVQEPELGIGGGVLYQNKDDEVMIEKTQDFHVRGATKIYRRACWNVLGGLLVSPGWDTVDELKAHFLGWKTHTFPEIKVLHQRPTGAIDGTWRNAIKHGVANYVAGYHPLFVAVKCLKRTVRKPYLVDGLGIFYGYLRGYLKGPPRVQDSALVQYIRNQQIRRLFFRQSIWK